MPAQTYAVPPALRWALLQFGSDPAFADDVGTLLEVDQEKFTYALNAARSVPGFLGAQRLRDIFSEHVEDRAADAMVNFATNLSRMRNKTDAAPADLVAGIISTVAASPLAARHAPDEERESSLRQRIAALADIAGVERDAKAATLASATGHVAQKIAIVCDYRPVFSDDKSTIVGLMPLSTLRIEHDGPGDAFEIVLAPAQVNDLLEAVSMAQNKLSVMRGLAEKLERDGVDLPEGWDT